MIHIIQLLCPQRHCIYAVAYDVEEMPDDVALAMFQLQFDKWVDEKVLNRECGICKSTKLEYETRRTKYKTIAEAEPALKAAEAANIESRKLIDAQKANRN
jgi:hypothetical protein